MTVNRVLLTICACLVLGCSSQIDVPELEVQMVKEINTDHLMPKSYLINSKVGQLGDTLFYWDKTIFQLVLVDKKFNWVAGLLGERGVGPDALSFHSGHSVIDNMYFIYGQNVVVFDARTLGFLGKYKLPQIDVDWIIKYQDKYLVGGLFYEENTYSVFSLDFSLDKGFDNQKKLFDIEFPERLDELSKVTKALVLNDFLFILKPDLGELVKVDSTLSIVSDNPLPYSFTKEENIIDYGDELDIDIYECWDFTAKDGRLFFLRTLDLANLHLPKEAVSRKTIHVLNADEQVLGALHLKEKAVFISFVDDELVTIDQNNEKYVKYKVTY
ncbi:hypothetical protein [Roseivirga misakiensis]|uniref:Phytase-like domain-containing protein n=1 Tax=Roseivirga misakiensis TaxID=1563681 RepID=A0A1E5T6W8_9BACT|nr:hypothetical protein [Roseivirga misakiensis]OEK07119.1 hypothetical protein BFP71_05530 [Roseivirga misakiensis]